MGHQAHHQAVPPGDGTTIGETIAAHKKGTICRAKRLCSNMFRMELAGIRNGGVLENSSAECQGSDK